MVTLWWLWWCNRNRQREGEKTMDAGTIAHQTRCSAAEYFKYFGKQKENKTKVQSRWTTRDWDTLKFITLHGAFTLGHSHSGWGVVARDHRGEVVAATVGLSEYINDPLHAEMVTTVQAMSLRNPWDPFGLRWKQTLVVDAGPQSP
jgi:hypothetical protein